MRKLMWFTIGFSGVCGLWAYRTGVAWVFPLAVLLAIAVAGGLRKGALCRILSAVLCGSIAAMLWTGVFERQRMAPAYGLDGTEQRLTITAGDYSEESAYGMTVDGTIFLEGRSCRIRVYLDEPEEPLQICPGDILEGTFNIRATVPGGTEESAYHQGKGVFLICYSRGAWTITSPEKISYGVMPAVWARKITDRLDLLFPGDVRAFVKALLLGNTQELDYETDSALKVSGIRHIVAVSGLHISVLFAAVTVITQKNRFLTLLLGIPVLVMFGGVAGFTPSVTRACVMMGLMMLSNACLREYDPPTALSAACLAMLAVNPLVITSANLQMSALCVAGMLLFREPIRNWIQERLPKNRRFSRLAGSVSVSLSTMLLVVPLSAYYFGTVSLIGPVTNLLTLWVVSGVFVGIVGVCLISAVWMRGAAALAWVLAWPIRYVLGCAKILSRISMAAVYTASIYVVFWLIFCYMLLTAFYFQRKRTPRILACCAGLGLCLTLILSWMQPKDEVCVTMLDVGQGQCILLQTEGSAFLIDCGGDSDGEAADIAAEHLLSRGVTRLDGVILTHGHRDHSGGLENLLTRVNTDLLILPDAPDTLHPTKGYGEVLYLWDTTEVSFPGGKLTVFGPVFHGESNENSLCVLFESEKCDILITGDRSDFGERMLMRKAQLPDVDILVAGHHGDSQSTSRELLAAVTPELVLISAGEDNRYGHPHSKLLERLAEAGIAVRRTDLEGTIIIRR